ncbi:Myotubularin- protein 14 [Modicella reniformis]|uniref:Myotubularin- protein 14 n=1 Tax=Modicella reniformis TaxID=1440133 RepID=A0A9P6LSD8_9FUNG|nr:Myotubularin- protein 14 [Modicella reniformis]
MAHSLIEAANQSFDLDESGMSFHDIRTELDMIHPSQTLQQKHGQQHILPFPFRIPRPEKKDNVVINEYMAPSSTTRDHKAIRELIPSILDKDKVNDARELSKQFEKSHFARVRARFVVPCILVRGKNICRSATLSNEVEVIMHSVISDLNQKRKMFLFGSGEKSTDKDDRESSLEKQRMEDIELLRQLGVTYINDLMVENRKVNGWWMVDGGCGWVLDVDMQLGEHDD